MATAIALRNPQTNLTATVYRGFSWTTLFFGPFPALFRGDFVTFALALVICFCTGGFAWLLIMFVWSFIYNGYHAKSLISKGYMVEAEVEAKKAAEQAAAAKQSTVLADAIAKGVAAALASRS
jgi:hypothetical protein